MHCASRQETMLLARLCTVLCLTSAGIWAFPYGDRQLSRDPVDNVRNVLQLRLHTKHLPNHRYPIPQIYAQHGPEGQQSQQGQQSQHGQQVQQGQLGHRGQLWISLPQYQNVASQRWSAARGSGSRMSDSPKPPPSRLHIDRVLLGILNNRLMRNLAVQRLQASSDREFSPFQLSGSSLNPARRQQKVALVWAGNDVSSESDNEEDYYHAVNTSTPLDWLSDKCAVSSGNKQVVLAALCTQLKMKMTSSTASAPVGAFLAPVAAPVNPARVDKRSDFEGYCSVKCGISHKKAADYLSCMRRCSH